MKHFFQHLLLLLCFGIAQQPVSASHYMGVDMWYECIGACNYRIYHSTYLDCTGGATQPYLPPSLANPFPAPAITITGAPGTCSVPTITNWK